MHNIVYIVSVLGAAWSAQASAGLDQGLRGASTMYEAKAEDSEGDTIWPTDYDGHRM